MPLPTDSAVVATSHEVVDLLRKAAGSHPGYRPAHAKGILVKGTFTPTPEAATLSIAPHFNKSSTDIWVRFSNSGGLPTISDADPSANPRGIAIRFNLGARQHTDIVAHSTPFFPARTGQEFADFVKAIFANGVPAFLESHPAAAAFVAAPKPSPVSFVKQQYWSVTAYKFIDKEKKERFVRYIVVPDSGVHTVKEEGVENKDYLETELRQRLDQANDSVSSFKLVVQIAAEDDVTNDAAVHWPETREQVVLGTIKLDSVLPDQVKEQQHIIFDPIPRVEGVDVSEDPLLDVRAGIYLISGNERRSTEAPYHT